MARVLVGMSGGVDSSVAAALLLSAGHEVIGVTLQLGREGSRGSDRPGQDPVLEARRAAEVLGIEHHVFDAAEAFEREVVEPFVDAYAAGRTPNPCVVCNERVKFAALARQADALRCSLLATGHYARIVRAKDGSAFLARAGDASKDQSYFLYRVDSAVLARTVFPLGVMTKAEVRARAAALGLPAARRAESQEVCFAEDHLALVRKRRPEAFASGAIETPSGEVVGTHTGVARYTVGQRKGLGIGGPGGPWRVVAVDAGRNVVVVGTSAELAARVLVLADPVWRISQAETRCEAQVRYRARPVVCTARFDGQHVRVEFEDPREATAPGQSVVLYDGDAVIGGGVLERWEPWSA